MSKHLFNSPPKEPNLILQSLPYLYSPQAKEYSNSFLSPRIQQIKSPSKSPICKQQFFISPRKLEHINCIINKTSTMGGLYIGDSISTLKQSILIENDIQAIICCNVQASSNLNSFFDESKKPQFKFIDIQDHQNYPINKHFEQAYGFIQKHRGNNKNVLIQCHAGVSRSGSILISYLMRKNKWSFKTALQFVTQKRPRIKPNAGFHKILQQFQFSNKQSIKSNSFETNPQQKLNANNCKQAQKYITPFNLMENMQSSALPKSPKSNRKILITMKLNENGNQQNIKNQYKQNKFIFESQNPELQKKKCLSFFNRCQNNFETPIKINKKNQIENKVSQIQNNNIYKNTANRNKNYTTFQNAETELKLINNNKVYHQTMAKLSTPPNFNILSPQAIAKNSLYPCSSVKFNYTNIQK